MEEDKFLIPLYSEVDKVDFWVPPQADSLMLKLVSSSGRKINLDFLPLEDEEGRNVLPPEVYINELMVELSLGDRKRLLNLLSSLIKDNRIGHPQGLTVITAKLMIKYFTKG